MTNATAFWGTGHATAAICITTASTGTETCNGDGDNIIDISAGSNELFRFWQHLANAGSIEGVYDGVTHGSTFNSGTSANAPTSKLNNALWLVAYTAASGNSARFLMEYGNNFSLGGYAANVWPNVSVFTPPELWSIDQKLDDGKPALRKLVIFATGGVSACTTSVANDYTTLTVDYLLTSTSVACTAIFRQQF